MSPSKSILRSELLLRLRNDSGLPLSGAELARELGVTRTAVWKEIQALRQEGFLITAQKRRGYLLEQEPDAPTRERLGPLLSGSLFRPELYHFYPTLASTNREASALARAGAPEGTLVFADAQTQGRGRLGRSWSAPPGCNLSFSFLLRPPLEPRLAAQVTLLAGIALEETMREVQVPRVTLKWPNDLLLSERKVAGILTEMEAEAEQVRFLVVGIGLNVHGAQTHHPEEIASVVATLEEETGRRFKRFQLLALFLHSFERWYRLYLERGFAPVREVWQARSGIHGRKVTINLMRESFSGVALALDHEGFLMVLRDDGKVVRVVAGDVSYPE